MSEAVCSPWIPVCVLAALALLARRLLRSWLAPSSLVALVWAVYAGLCLTLTDYEVRAGAMWMIVALVFSTQCGAFLSQTVAMRSTSSRADDAPQGQHFGVLIRRALSFSMLFTCVALAGALYSVFWSVSRFNVSFSLPDLLGLGNMWSAARYIEGAEEPWTVRLLVMWVYPAALLGGLVFAAALNRRQKYLSFLPFAPALLSGAVQAARAGTLIALVCWLSAFFALRYKQTRGRYPLFHRRSVLSLAAVTICGLMFFVAIDSVRVFRSGERLQVTEDLPRMRKYIFGAVPAFSGWFHSYTQQTPTLGAYTVAGIFDLLGIKPRQTGVYEDYRAVSDGEMTNIYTAFRGLLQDFTPAGAVVVVFLVGLLAGAACRFLAHPGALLALAGYYAVILCSPVISLFVYNGLVLAWCISALVLSCRLRGYPLRTIERIPAVSF